MTLNHFQGCTCFDCIDNKLAEQKAQLEQCRHAFNLLQHNFTEQQRVNNAEMNRLSEALATEKRRWVKDDRNLNALVEQVARLEAELKEALQVINRAHSTSAFDCVCAWCERRKAKP